MLQYWICRTWFKKWAKQPSKTSQKRGDGVYESQCASRLYDTSMYKYATNIMEEADDEYDISSIFIDQENGDNTYSKEERSCGTRFNVSVLLLNRRKRVVVHQVDSRGKVQSSPYTDLDESILKYFLLRKKVERFMNSLRR